MGSKSEFLGQLGCSLLMFLFFIFFPFCSQSQLHFGPNIFELFSSKYNLSFWSLIKFWFFSWTEFILFIVFFLIIHSMRNSFTPPDINNKYGMLTSFPLMIGFLIITLGLPMTGMVSFNLGLIVLILSSIIAPISAFIIKSHNSALVNKMGLDSALYVTTSIVLISIFSFIYSNLALFATSDLVMYSDNIYRKTALNFIKPRLLLECGTVSILISLLISYLIHILSKYRFWGIIIILITFAVTPIGSFITKFHDETIIYIKSFVQFVPEPFIKFLVYIFIYVGFREIISIIKSKIKSHAISE